MRAVHAFAAVAAVGAALALGRAAADGRAAAGEHGGHAEERAGGGHAGEHDGGAPAEERAHSIAAFERIGVRLAVAGPGEVDAAIELPGEVRPDGDHIAHLAPRFRGIAREVRKHVGDEVAAGEVLAIVEGDNLVRFPVVSAFAGTVIDRHVAEGEVVSPEEPIFIVADLSVVWVEVDVYQSALGRVRVGQPVRVVAGGGGPEADGTVAYVSPVVDQATRTARARVVLANRDRRWRPGSFTTVHVMDPAEASVVVPRRAVHRLDGEPVVFVAAGDRFTAQPVRLGRAGRTLVAVASGLAPGQRYADEGAFLVKAELAAGEEAGHAH